MSELIERKRFMVAGYVCDIEWWHLYDDYCECYADMYQNFADNDKDILGGLQWDNTTDGFYPDATDPESLNKVVHLLIGKAISDANEIVARLKPELEKYHEAVS